HPVLDADDRVAADPPLIQADELGRAQRLALAGEAIHAVVEELAGRRIERERNLVASLVAGLRDRVDDELQRLLVGGEAGRESSLVPYSGGQLLLLEHALERVIDLGHRTQRLRVR